MHDQRHGSPRPRCYRVSIHRSPSGRPSGTRAARPSFYMPAAASMSRRLASLVSVAFLLACVALPAAAKRSIGFDAYALPGSGTLAVPVREGDAASGAFADLDAATDGALSRAVAAAGFKGRSGSTLDLPGIGGYDRVLLVGVGKDEVTPRVLEDFGGLVGQDAARSAAPRIEVLWRGEEADAASHIAFGAELGQYRFDR